MDIIKIPEKITKSVLLNAAQHIHDLVISGENEPLDIYVQIKAYEEIIKEAKKLIKDEVFLSAEKFVKDDLYPVKVEISQIGDRLDYEKDQEWNDINTALKARADKLKQAHKINLSGGVFVDDTGEVVPVVPVKTESQSVVKITFKK